MCLHSVPLSTAFANILLSADVDLLEMTAWGVSLFIFQPSSSQLTPPKNATLATDQSVEKLPLTGFRVWAHMCAHFSTREWRGLYLLRAYAGICDVYNQKIRLEMTYNIGLRVAV